MNAPILRFKEFTDEWSNISIDKKVTRVIRKNSQLESTIPLTISAEYGLVDQTTYFNKYVAATDLSGYYLIKKGEFAYNKSYSKNYPWGAIKRLDNYDKGVLSTLYICFSINENTNSDYIKHYFESDKWYKEISMIAVEGARNHGLLNISVNDFFKIQIKIPSIGEQFKISVFFETLDTKIKLQKEKVNSLKEQKKGYMQKIFSQELRFKDVDGKEFSQWKSIKLNNLASKITTKNKDLTVKNVISNSAKNGLISQKDFFDKEIANQENIDGYYVISNGDFVYNPRISIDAPYGPINIYKSTEDGIVSPLYMCFSVKDINKEYLYHYFKGTLWYKYIYMHGDSGARYDRVSIKDSTFLEMPILVPSIAEQNLIANFISTLQNKIDIEEKKLEGLLNQKQAFMQQMFI